MEVNMNRQHMENYVPIVRGERITEEVMETIVPDSYPDAEKISGCRATAMIRSKEAAAGRATVNGSAKAYILYEPSDGGSCRSLPVSLPFTVELMDPAIAEGSKLTAEPRVIAAEGRVVNSRKLQARVTVAVNIGAYDRREMVFCTELNCDCPLEILDAEASMLVTKEIKEKTFNIVDELTLDGGKPPIEDMLMWSADLRLNDKKLVGSKVVFKGDAAVDVVYRSPEGEASSQSFTMPFSQIVDFEGAEESDMCDVTLVPASMELQVADDYTESLNRFELNMNVLAQALVWGENKCSPIVDFYSTSYPSEAMTGQLQFSSLLDRNVKTQTLREQLDASETPAKVLSVNVTMPKAEQTVAGGRLNARQTVEAAVTYLTAGGKVATDKKRLEAAVNQDMADAVQVYVNCTLDGQPSAMTAGSSFAVEIPLAFDIMSTSERTLPILTEAKVSDEAADVKAMPSAVILKNPQLNVWELGKKYMSRTADIMRINGLEGISDPVEGKTLLIPKSV